MAIEIRKWKGSYFSQYQETGERPEFSFQGKERGWRRGVQYQNVCFGLA